ncbi:MAG TPA: PIN domain-containing protein [Thermoanaerobaculia bacterium]|jgi:hypothetical protein
MIIADTGFWVALANRRDRYHELAKEKLSELDEPLVSTWPVVTETCYLLLDRLGSESQRNFLLSMVEGAFDVFELDRSQVPHVVTLMEKYADLPMDLADASSVVLAEHLGHGRILSTDQRDYAAYRWKQREPFQNLLFS